MLGEIKEMQQCVNASLSPSRCESFRVHIATFLWPSFVIWPKESKLIVDISMKFMTEFMTAFTRNKAGSSCIRIIFIACCFLLTAPNKRRRSVSRTLPMVSSQCVSRYRDFLHNKN